MPMMLFTGILVLVTPPNTLPDHTSPVPPPPPVPSTGPPASPPSPTLCQDIQVTPLPLKATLLTLPHARPLPHQQPTADHIIIINSTRKSQEFRTKYDIGGKN